MVYTILGCGSSPGVPRIGNDWGACDPTNPKNDRLRCSFLVERITETGITRVLVDTSPDMRAQMLRHNVGHVDGVLYTHPHADHIHGIDDLRQFWIRQKQLIDIYADEATAVRLHEAFGYCFKTPRGSAYPPILKDNRIEPLTPVTISGAGGPVTALPIEQQHGDIISLGFVFDEVGYSSDVSWLSDVSYSKLEGIDTWIVDALRYKPHPSHFSVAEALVAAARVNARRTILTHMLNDLDYEELQTSLPEGVEPAYDGLTLAYDT